MIKHIWLWIIVFVLLGCNSITSIKLKGFEGSLKIALETKRASLTFGLEDCLVELEKRDSRFSQQEHREKLSKLFPTDSGGKIIIVLDSVYSTKLDTIPAYFFGDHPKQDSIAYVRNTSDWRSYYQNEFEWVAYNLLKAGKARVFNKMDLKNVGELHLADSSNSLAKWSVFKFDNDTPFLWNLHWIR